MNNLFKRAVSLLSVIPIFASLTVFLPAVQATETEFAPVNFMATGRDKRINVTWKNPNRDDISSIKLYAEDGTDISGEWDTVANAANDSLQQGLSNERIYSYNLVIAYSDGTEYTFGCSSKKLHDYGESKYNGNKGIYTFNSWNEYVAGNSYTRFSPQNKVVRSGNSALVIQRNSNRISNQYEQFVPNWKDSDFKYDTTKKYMIEFYYKRVNTSAVKVVRGKDVNTEYESISALPGEDAEWQKYTKIISGKGLNTIAVQSYPVRFCVEKPVEALYIDDFGVYEVNDSKEKTSENLIINGGFEDGDVTPPSNVTEAAYNYNAETKELALTWKNPTSDLQNVKIYRYKGGEKYCTFSANASAAELTGIEDNEQILISTVDFNENESTGVILTVIKPVDSFELKSYELIDNEDGTLTATAAIKNNLKGDDFRPSLIIAVYKNEEALYSVNVDTDLISEDEEKTLNANISVPTDDFVNSYTVKAFLWDNMNPLSNDEKRIDL